MASRIQLYKFALRTLRVARKYVPPALSSRGPQECVCHLVGHRPSYWSNDLRRHVYTAVPNETLGSHANETLEGNSEVCQTLSMLQMKKDRLGPLNIADIKTGIEKLKSQEVELSGDEFFQLLQMTIKAVEIEYRNCSDVVLQLLELYRNGKDKPLTLRHIELYYKICLLAEVPLTSKVMLSLIEEHNIDVSKELVEIMILILGRHGRIDDTADILALMKRKSFPVSEVIFSGIIFAHGFNRDLEGINSVVETMRNLQMEFSSITYHALMIAYAVAGDFSKVKSVVQQMNKAKVDCTLSQLKSLLIDIVKSNEAGKDFENMDYVVELMKQKESTLDLSVIVLHLIHHNHAPEAIRLLSSHAAVLRNREYYNNGLIYIKEMVACLQDADLLVNMCQQLEESGLNKYASLVALETALKEHREEVTWVLLKSLKERGKPIRQHYFWPLLNGSKSIKASKVMEFVQNMVALGTPPDVETLKEFIIPSLTLKDPGAVERMLKDVGLTVSVISSPLLTVLIQNNMIAQAMEYAKTLRVDFSLHDLTTALAKAWTTSPNSAISLLAILIKKAREHETSGNLEDWGGQFLLDITSSRNGLDKHQIVPLFKELKKNEIGISEISADFLVGRANESIQAELKEHVHMIVDKSLGHPPKEQDYNMIPHPNDMNIEELEGHLTELQTKGFKTRGTIRRLILLHAKKNNTERVLSLVKDLEETGEKMSSGMLATLLSTYVSAENFDAALNVYIDLKQAHPSFTLDEYKVIDFSTALVKNGRIEEAVKILGEAVGFKGNDDNARKQVRRNCQALLMAAAATRKYEVVKEIFDILKRKSIIRIDNLMLGPLVKCRLNNGDYVGAVEEVRSVAKKFKCLPMKIEVLMHLLHNIKKAELDGDSFQESRDKAKHLLEEMVNIIARINGPISAQHDLLFACLEAGYPSKATQVLKSLGRKIDKSLIQRQCQRYAATSREEPLQNFLMSSKSVPGISREGIFYSLLTIYHVQNNSSKGLSLWTQMQEENVLPSEAFLGTLASLLASNEISIPFDVSWNSM
ncbi:leucine-rich PPR motif-containing protein, mitochondrial-like isoform X2 [Palaemon carinicauda]|uniref:leucine-rich PPR motif-containing protein, mitochondrial-like isoform X2 n=1 Tax=Palaemon carinicauda TaxID=392227 RepID=UPI0035B69656